ncbi:MAG: UDP-2,3-diacylglucosamine diphosphatase [Bacteroidota bacterium]
MTEPGKKIRFASDLHLGMHPKEKSRERERAVTEWLDEIKNDTSQLWLVGDIFDYWFEYRRVVPRGFIRFLGKLAELSDMGIEIHIFTGNHDVWYFGYLPDEIGAIIHREPVILELGSKTFLIGHGDGLTWQDKGYLFIKWMFKNRFLQWCYARIHPNGSAGFAHWWSRRSRYSKGFCTPWQGVEKEEQIIFSEKISKENPDIDYFIYGHRHIPYVYTLSSGSRVFGLGDWIVNFTYGEFDGEEMKLKKRFEEKGEIVTFFAEAE